MGSNSFCPVCRRAVYVENDAPPVCPVCMTPLPQPEPESRAGDDFRFLSGYFFG